MPSTRDINDAVPRLGEAWAHLAEQWPLLHPDDPKPFLIEVFRPTAVQRAYYAQGREKVAIVNSLRRKAGLAEISEAENRRKITNAKPGQSKHELSPSRAFDIAFLMKGKKGVLDYTPRLFSQAADIIRPAFPDVVWGGDFNNNHKADDRFIDQPHFQV